MRPNFPIDILDEAFGLERDKPTLTPCPSCEADGVDRLCEVCSGTGMVTVDVRAAWLAVHGQ